LKVYPNDQNILKRAIKEENETMEKTKPVGRTLRLLTGSGLIFYVAPIYFRTDLNFNLASLGIVVGLILLYIVVHYVVSRYLPNINQWFGALVALIPVSIVFILGMPGNSIFGRGEGAIAAMTFVGVSLIIDFIRADSGCEVMAIPGLLAKNRTHLACATLTPIDMLETKLTEKFSSKSQNDVSS